MTPETGQARAASVPPVSPQDVGRLAAETWDVIVIGTGMGGATLGHALAIAGERVLFLEKGASTLANSAARGDYPEARRHRKATAAEIASGLRDAGRWTEPIGDATSGRVRSFVPFIGAGTGGSTGLYGMVLERFAASDFTPRASHPDASDADLPSAWPVGLAELSPYYDRAEALYRVDTRRVDAGSTAPPSRSPAVEELAAHLTSRGLRHYRLPLACDAAAACSGCQGFLCARGCKNDSAKICLEPAIDAHGATLVHDCAVVALEADAQRVTRVICRHHETEVAFAAKTIVLAAGALATPALLLASVSAEWPDGLANRSGLVGRYLMRHAIDLYLVKVSGPVAAGEPLKQLGVDAFYAGAEGKFGTLQSFGHLLPPAMVADDLQALVRSRHGRWPAALLGLAKPLVRGLLQRFTANRIVLAGMMEDLPSRDNRVELDRSGRAARLQIRYRLQPHDRRRVRRFRELVTTALGRSRVRLVRQAENNALLAHACGTCRFGTDPATSVLDANNRAHGIENLYVVDASFFPSSGGTNPSLTIAANALRVADHLIAKRAAKEATATATIPSTAPASVA